MQEASAILHAIENAAKEGKSNSQTQELKEIFQAIKAQL
jgi:hypothetical protein